jgi:hypothetical protein
MLKWLAVYVFIFIALFQKSVHVSVPNHGGKDKYKGNIIIAWEKRNKTSHLMERMV